MHRPFKAFLAISIYFLVAALTPGMAHAGSTFSESQRKEIVQIMRQAMKDDPSIIDDAIESLKSRAREEANSATAKQLKAQSDLLISSPVYATRGNPHADVTIVEFFDPRCGYCKRETPIIDSLLKEDKNLRVIEKIVPVLGYKSTFETRAIIAAALQGGYEKMKHAVMSESTDPTISRIREIATREGLDANRLVKDMSSDEVAGIIYYNLHVARSIDLTGTPTFIFNTRTAVPGYMSKDDMKKEIAAARGQ